MFRKLILRGKTQATPVIIGVVFLMALVLVYLTWKKWANPQIDFGRELYTPWQLTEGKVLYRDIFHPYGPLSQYYHALLFSLFGVNWNVLIVSNIVLLFGYIVILSRILLKITGKIGMFLGLIVFVFQFAFDHYGMVGNYNYLAPYSHEAIHGLFLCLVLLYALFCCPQHSGLKYSSLLGLIHGTILLTKPEFVAAASGVLLTHLVLCNRNHSFRSYLSKLAGLLLGSLAMPGIFIIYFSSYMPLVDAIEGTFQAFGILFRINPQDTFFFQQVGGWHQPWIYLKSQLSHFAILGLGIFALYTIDTLIKRKSIAIKVFIGLPTVVLMGFFVWKFDWLNLGKVFPLSLIILGALACRNLFFPTNAALQFVGRRQILLTVMAFLLLLKMGLNVSIYHYGFVLALPSAICWVFLLWEMPLRKEYPGMIYRSGIIILLLGGSLVNLDTSMQWYHRKTTVLKSPHEEMVTLSPAEFPMVAGIYAAQDWLDNNLKPNQTLLVMPEGILLNYFNRAANPTPLVHVLPLELLVYGESNYFNALTTHPPDVIIYLNRDLREYGLTAIGDQDYLVQLNDWIQHNYSLQYTYGGYGNTRTDIAPCMAVYSRRNQP